MKNKKTLAILATLFLLAGSFTSFYFLTKNKKSALITSAKGDIGNFSLLDHTGVFHELYRYSDAKAIVIISQGNDCPIIQKYSTVINEIKKKFENQKIIFFLLNANKQDDRDSIQKEVKSYGFDIPVLMDPSQVVADTLGVTRTSEAVVLSPNGWKILYRGSISDRFDYGSDKQKARNNYLEDVLTSIAQDKTITTMAVPAKGCLITFSKPDLSYEQTIAPIIANKCLGCHSENGKFLPYFNSYSKFKNWSAMSRETIFTDRMPPTSIDTYYGSYKHDMTLLPEEKRALIKWIDAGSPFDGKEDLLTKPLPKTPHPLKKFKLYHASMNEDKIVPPEGENEYQYLQLGGQIPADMWVRALHVTSTNPRLLHHMSIMGTSQPLDFYIDYQAKNHPVDEVARKNNKEGTLPLHTKSSIYEYEAKNGFASVPRFQIWAAGKKQPFALPPGVVSFFPKGSYLILESHYMGTGKIEKEKTSITFYGFRKKINGFKQIHTQTIVNLGLKIPPMVKNFVVETPEWKPKKDIHLLGFLAHLHMRGRSAKIQTTNNAGDVGTLLSIPNFYYGWQTGTPIIPTEPIAIKGDSTTFKGICNYDNSPQNPYNPDPGKTVLYGQRHDTAEMCHFHFNFTVDSE